jgi:hypothetical protein
MAMLFGWYGGKPIVNTRFSIRSLRQLHSICTLLPTESGGKNSGGRKLRNLILKT